MQVRFIHSFKIDTGAVLFVLAYNNLHDGSPPQMVEGIIRRPGGTL